MITRTRRLATAAVAAGGLVAPAVALAGPAAAAGGPYITEVQVHEIAPSQIAQNNGFPVQVDAKVPYGEACAFDVYKYSSRTGTWVYEGYHNGYAPDLYFTDYIEQPDLNTSIQYSVIGYDCNGNSGNQAYSTTFIPHITDQNFNWTGTHSIVYNSNAFVGSYSKSSGIGATQTYYPDGVYNFAVYGETGPWGGQVAVYVDGVKKSTVSFYTSTVKYRKLMFKYGTSSAANHTVQFQVVGKGSGGGTSFGLDGSSELRNWGDLCPGQVC